MRKIWFLLGVLVLPFAVRAGNLPPQPPCGVPPRPAYPVAGAAPSFAIWNEARLREIGWHAPDCLGWGATRTRLAVALAGTFQFSGSVDQLLDRYGRLSEHKSIRYWSTTDKVWKHLVSDAAFVDGSEGRSLPDLASADLVSGKVLFYFEVGRSGRTTYRLKVLERTADRTVLATDNVTPILFSAATLFEPASLQSVTFLERLGPDVWGYYQITRAAAGASVLALGSEASYVNRSVALYRHLAGLRTDGDSPAMP